MSLAQCFLLQLSICSKIECKYGNLILHSKIFTVCLWECSTVCTLLLHCDHDSESCEVLVSAPSAGSVAFPGFAAWMPLDHRGWTSVAYQSQSIPTLPSWARERKYNERLKGQGKDRERSVTSYCPGKSKPNLGKKSLMYYQLYQNREIRNKPKS